jgi:hypothetical protein
MVLLIAPGTSVVELNLPDWTSSQHTWIAWDGTEWDLSHGLSGLALQSGVRGLKDPPITRWKTQSPAVSGSIFRGVVTDEREIFWPIKVFANSGSNDWIVHNSRFWRTLDPNRTGQWVVTQPNGTRRTLTCRFTGLDDDSDDISPELVGFCVYGINLVAEQPYWVGETTTRIFENVTGQNFYGGSGGGGFGPPFYLSSGTTLASASTSNPGDVPVSPVWRINGPSTDCTVIVDGHTIAFPMSIGAGHWVELDTAPTSQVALDDLGVDRTAELGAVDFAEIRPGDNVPLTVSMTGGGSVSMKLTAAYRRAM